MCRNLFVFDIGRVKYSQESNREKDTIKMLKQSYTFQSPIGILTISEAGGYLTDLFLERENAGLLSEKQSEQRYHPHSEVLYETYCQLREYFAGNRREFTIPIRAEGTMFQKRVWEELRKIPYGATRSYAEIADGIGNPKAVRAVGQANHRNPILILVPCHRVIHKNGDISGFGCGDDVKRYLLELEGRKER